MGALHRLFLRNRPSLWHNEPMRKSSGSIFKSLALLPLLLSCSSKGQYSKVVFAMDTSITCLAEAEKEEELTDVLSPFEYYDSIADANYHHYSSVDVYDINQASSPVSISKDLFDLLNFALEMEKETEGYFNPLCYGLSTLWKNALHPSLPSEPASLPEQSAIDSELAKIANTELLLEEKEGAYTAYLSAKDETIGRASIDLGGIAKGYAAQKAKEKASSYRWEHYYINGGSSTLVFGSNTSNDGYYSVEWKEDLPGKRLLIKDACLSTSSITVQGVRIGDKTYSHIVNPFTGEASPSFTGVTLKGNDAGKLDAYTTALMWAKPSERERLEKKWGVEGIYYKDGEVIEDRLLGE